MPKVPCQLTMVSLTYFSKLVGLYQVCVNKSCSTEELERRARNRARQEREERRRERACRRAIEGPPKPDFSSHLMFPPAASFSSPPLEPSPLHRYEQAGPSTSVGSPPSPGLSFAKV